MSLNANIFGIEISLYPKEPLYPVSRSYRSAFRVVFETSALWGKFRRCEIFTSRSVFSQSVGHTEAHFVSFLKSLSTSRNIFIQSVGDTEAPFVLFLKHLHYGEN
ncbi:hypothetical protein FRX31_002873 [Thalictrum thalictroides]|uniref:Uncharacterized protein n=1 Tax=Thalictrum thalictroides TaxID=46969 RepID=A0A7J6XGC8_THATH|nr:hypothetical protein FRX31_002873 [Thalictrum thalictroides]